TGLDWHAARELIRRSLAEARATGGSGAIVCGAGTDQLAPADAVTLADVERAYEEQVGYVEEQGGRVVLMASRALARAARGPDDYARVYGTVLRQVSRPVILHWLGDMFGPQLAGYWGTPDVHQALDRDDVPAYHAALAPTVLLARHIFEAPTHAYKTGIVFLAYLNGHQPHFRMIGGAESWRSVPHLAELFRLADAAGLLADPDGAANRMRRVLALAGLE